MIGIVVVSALFCKKKKMKEESDHKMCSLFFLLALQDVGVWVY